MARLLPHALLALSALGIVVMLGTPGDSAPAHSGKRSASTAPTATAVAPVIEEETTQMRVDRLIQRLSASRLSDRDKAALTLIEIGQDATHGLKIATRSSDPAVRERARAILQLIAPDGAESKVVRTRRAVELVRRALTTPDGLSPGGTLDLHMHRLHPEVGDELAKAARSATFSRLLSPELAAAVARHASDEGLLVLTDLLVRDRMSPSGSLRAIRALTRRRPGSKYPPLRRIGKKARALARRTLADAIKDAPSPRRRAAVTFFAALARPADAGLLASWSDDRDEGVRKAVAAALGKWHQVDARAVLMRLAGDASPRVRVAALSALRADDPHIALPSALKASRDHHALVRVASVDTLASADTTASRRALERLRHDDSARVRAATRRALKKLASAAAARD